MLSQADLLHRMAADLAMLPSHLEKIIQTAPLRYKLFTIPKRAGGVREVAQPAREVKAIQRWVMQQIGPYIPIHPAATAYLSGSSILGNAAAHVDSRYMLKLDFANFFPSILRSDLCLHLDRHCAELFEPNARRLVAHVCCWARLRELPLKLCIGAPSSPLLSNSVMFEFDTRLNDIAEADEVVYTRYADDITLSSGVRGKVDRYEALVRNLLAELEYPKLKLNEGKTVLASRAGKRVVTGLVLTPEGNVSIGRERKRRIRAMFHRSLTHQLDADETQELAGLLAFADSIEPGFSQRLKQSMLRKAS